MRKVVLLPLFTLLVGCAPGATITSAGRSFDRVQVGEEWAIEYTLNGQVERGTFTVKGEPRRLTCGSGCEEIASLSSQEARVAETASGTGQILIWEYRSGKRVAAFEARRLGRFDDTTCYVTLGTRDEPFKASITPNGAATSESGTCRVLSVR